MSLQWVNIHGSSRYWNAGLWRSFLLKWALWRPLPLTAVHSALGVPPELPGVPCGVWHPAVKPTDFPTGLLGPHRGCTISVHPIPVTAHSPVATCHLGACYELNWSESASHSVVSDSLWPPGSSVHGFLQARILEWVAIPFSRGSCQARDGTWLSHTAGRLCPLSHQGKPPWAELCPLQNSYAEVITSRTSECDYIWR